jgi:hypothetical protein
VSAPSERSPLDAEQLTLPGLSPAAGSRWRNRNTGSIAAVLRVDQRHKGWLTMRIAGSEQTVTVASFLRHFTPYQSTNGRQQR